MPVGMAKCWWLLKIEPNAWVGGKGSCAVCIDFQAVGVLKFFGELNKGFGPFLGGFGWDLEKGRVLFLVTTSISPFPQASVELHALSSLRNSIALAVTHDRDPTVAPPPLPLPHFTQLAHLPGKHSSDIGIEPFRRVEPNDGDCSKPLQPQLNCIGGKEIIEFPHITNNYLLHYTDLQVSSYKKRLSISHTHHSKINGI